MLTNSSIFEHASGPSNTEESREKMPNYHNSVSNLDEKLLSVAINLKNADPDTQHEIDNPIARSQGLFTEATVTDEGRLQG